MRKYIAPLAVISVTLSTFAMANSIQTSSESVEVKDGVINAPEITIKLNGKQSSNEPQEKIIVEADSIEIVDGELRAKGAKLYEQDKKIESNK